VSAQNTIPAIPQNVVPHSISLANSSSPAPTNEPPPSVVQLTHPITRDPPKATLDCRIENINGKNYECCLEFPKDPTVRACSVLKNN
jgi:hypothetical protein